MPGAESGAAGDRGAVPAGGTVDDDPALQFIIDCWPALPEAVRREVLAVIRRAAQGQR